MKNEPLISVIIPVYNVELYLRRCLDAVTGQTYRNLDIICVDDGSPDGCGAICEEYASKDDRICVIHKENGGLSSARNAGIEIAHGDFVSFIDSDDTVEPDMIEYLYQLTKKHKADISVCLHTVVRGERCWKSYDLKTEEVIGSKEAVGRLLYDDGISVSSCAKLYKKEIWNEIRFPEGKIFEDVGIIHRTFLLAKIIVLGNETKYNYILRENSTTNDTFDRRQLDMLEMTDRMVQDVLAVYPDLGKAALRREVYAHFSTLNRMMHAGSEWESQRREMIDFIKANAGALLADSKVQRRDKIACIVLSIGYPLYKFVWEHMGKK